MGSAVGVSVVFPDLVGSTELSTRVGAAAAEALRQVHFGLLRDALVPHGGREVKNLGDGIMAVFPGVGAALEAAVGMQQAFGWHNATSEGAGQPMRGGVAASACGEEEGGYFGPHVIAPWRLWAQSG